MNIKTVLLISLIIQFNANSACIAGKTSFSGSASCFMPYQLEFEEQKIEKTDTEDQTAPTVIGANGEYEVQKEIIKEDKEKMPLWNENDMATIEETITHATHNANPETKPNSETIIYTIYAR